MSISGDVSDWQPARCDLDEIRNNSKNLKKSSGDLKKEGIEKRGGEEPLQSILLPCFQGKASTYGQERLSHVYDKQCREYWDLYSKWRRCIWKIPRPHGVSELDCELPNRSLVESEEPHARVAVDEGNRSSQIAG